jgi:membrane associated rhomboid family serine protease
MVDTTDKTVLDLPKVYLVRMMVFTLIVGIIAAVLYPSIQRAFQANVGLNGLIIAVLLLGILYCFRMVWRLWPEINWVNHFRIADPNLDVPYTPRLLAPMQALLRDRQGRTVLSTMSMRSMLDSLASRLDEARDISRYLVGLLIFLGLLGTFWGLLETVTSVGDAIKSLDVTATESGTVFENLKAGLERPLAGMGLSFSSSLFGLAGSLILGFLDLQASQAQNRFYTDLEDWLSTITDIEAGESQLSVPHYLRLDLQGVQKGIERINKTLDDALGAEPAAAQSGASSDSESLDRLAGAVANLVNQMREEQKIVRQWAQNQQAQQSELHRLILRTSGQTPAPPRPGAPRLAVEDEE